MHAHPLQVTAAARLQDVRPGGACAGSCQQLPPGRVSVRAAQGAAGRAVSSGRGAGAAGLTGASIVKSSFVWDFSAADKVEIQEIC